MKMFKSPWFYTAIVAFFLLFTPFSRELGTRSMGWGQQMGLTNGKQIAVLYAIITFLPIVIAFYMFRFALKDLRK